MRPQSIVTFERLFLLAWVLSTAATIIGWGATWQVMQQNREMRALGPAIPVAVTVVGAALPLVLLYFTTRRASVIAKWLLLFLIAVSASALLLSFARQIGSPSLPALLSGAAVLVRVMAARLLFRSDSRAWFGEIPAPAAGGEADRPSERDAPRI